MTDDSPIRVYVNKIENRIIFRIKTGYYLKILTAETIKVLRSTKGKITKDKNGKNVPQLETNKVVLFHYNIFNNDHQHNSRAL